VHAELERILTLYDEQELQGTTSRNCRLRLLSSSPGGIESVDMHQTRDRKRLSRDSAPDSQTLRLTLGSSGDTMPNSEKLGMVSPELCPRDGVPLGIARISMFRYRAPRPRPRAVFNRLDAEPGATQRHSKNSPVSPLGKGGKRPDAADFPPLRRGVGEERAAAHAMHLKTALERKSVCTLVGSLTKY
jgi:hypothetical protein